MTAGFQAWTDTGLYQIDGSTPCFGLRVHTVLATSNQSITWGRGAGSAQYMTVPIASITFNAAAPVVAFFSPNCAGQMLSCNNVGTNTWTAQFWTQTPTSIEIYVFDPVNNFGGSNFGLQVFDGSGALIADATVPVLKPMSYVSGNRFNRSGNAYVTSGYDSGAKQFGIPSAKVAIAAPLAASCIGNYIWCDGWQCSGGTATCTFHQLYHQGSGNDNNLTGYVSQMNWAALLIDVANF